MNKVTEFERRLLGEVKARDASILSAIRTDREIKPETEKKLVGFLDGFAKAFA